MTDMDISKGPPGEEFEEIREQVCVCVFVGVFVGWLSVKSTTGSARVQLLVVALLCSAICSVMIIMLTMQMSDTQTEDSF